MKTPEQRTCTIMPGTSLTHATLVSCELAVRTHKETCEADLLFIDNTCDNEAHRNATQKMVEGHGYKYEYSPDPFSWTKLCNYGAEKVKDDYDFVVFSNADVIYFPYWLHYLHQVWCHSEHTHFFSMHPFAYSPTHEGVNYRNTTIEDTRILPVDTPLMHTSLFRTDNLYKWDEQFTLYEADCDYWMWMKAQGLQAGISYLSRVDHATGGIVSGIGKRRLTVDLNGKEAFNKKWSPFIAKPENEPT